MPFADSSPLVRRVLAVALGLAMVAATTLAILPSRGDVSVATPALVLVVPGIVAGLLGGRIAALITAIAAGLVLDVTFIEPYGTLMVHLVDDVVVLVAFVAVAVTVATLFALANDRRRIAEQHAVELANLEETGHAQRALLRSVSHDLRTPLAAIRAVASDLRDGSADYDEATRRDLLDVVGDEAERLDRLVANLLSLSRIEAGALAPDIQAVDVDELVSDRVRRLSRLLQDVSVETHFPDVVPLVDADYTLLDQVITNLLENAAHHAPPHSVIRIDVRERGDRMEVAVSDQGRGVPPGDREWIFEAFRSGGSSRSTGIGLAICKAIVEAHEGSIGVSDAAGGVGARFAFTLPIHWSRTEVPG